MAPLMIFLGMLAVVSVLNPACRGPFGISIVTAPATPFLFVAPRQAMVLNIGSIDLSNASLILFGTILIALALPWPGILLRLAILPLLMLIGAVNGAIVACTLVLSFILPLGTPRILQTAVLVTTTSRTIYRTEDRELISVLDDLQFSTYR